MKTIQIDSRKIKPGDIFVALKGQLVDGHDFLEQAHQNGASLLVVEHPCNYPNVQVVADTKAYLDDYLASNYADLLKDLKVIGITGTNGKTTTCAIIYQLLNAIGIPCAMFGTIGYESPKSKEETINTTPDIITIYSFLLKAKEEGCKVVAMEVSSHGLHQGRIGKLQFDGAGFTNLTLDHLDYHKTMDTYASHKAIVLDHLKPNGKCLYNNDDAYKSYFQKENNLGYGMSECAYQILSMQAIGQTTTVCFQHNQKEYVATVDMLGKYNIYNFMQAISCLHEVGYDLEMMCKHANKVCTPEGRMNVYKLKKGYAVIDYAHTPNAVENILQTFCELEGKKIITVIGCGGDRDNSKRPIMAELVTKYSDYSILTMDNPRCEDVEDILDQMEKGCSNKNYERISDRSLAIKKAISMADEDTYVLLLGKGHEDYIETNKIKTPYSDAGEVKKYQ